MLFIVSSQVLVVVKNREVNFAVFYVCLACFLQFLDLFNHFALFFLDFDVCLEEFVQLPLELGISGTFGGIDAVFMHVFDVTAQLCLYNHDLVLKFLLAPLLGLILLNQVFKWPVESIEVGLGVL